MWFVLGGVKITIIPKMAGGIGNLTIRWRIGRLRNEILINSANGCGNIFLIHQEGAEESGNLQIFVLSI
ncbi:MAG: hypothetical protein LUI85_00905 [Bacteroides sp.]|nr:hypothetical protein [Bacteroides sp.]